MKMDRLSRVAPLARSSGLGSIGRTGLQVENVHRLVFSCFACSRKLDRTSQLSTKSSSATFASSERHLSRRTLGTGMAQSLQYSTQSPPGSCVSQQTYRKFYELPSIRYVRFLSRLKLYQTGLSVSFIPLCSAMYSYDLMTLANVQAAGAIAVGACAMLYFMSFYVFQRTVGMLSFNEAEDVVRVSYLSFLGARREYYLRLDDIYPLSDLPDEPNDVYVKLMWDGAKHPLYLSIRYGRIIDKIKFRKVMGAKSV